VWTKRNVVGTVSVLAASVLAVVAIAVPASASSNSDPKSRDCVGATQAWEKTVSDSKDPAGPGERHDGTVTTPAEQGSINDATSQLNTARANYITGYNAWTPSPGVTKTEAHYNATAGGAALKSDVDSANRRLDSANTAAVAPSSPGERHDGTVVTKGEQEKIAHSRALADKACTGPAGQPGTPGAPGAPGAAGQPGTPGGILIIPAPSSPAPSTGTAPAPETVETHLPVTH
jgi:hypothetical protein